MATEVKVPDIGDFDDVPVVAVLVGVGDTIAKEDPLIELESDKATMEVPSSHAGKVTEIKLAEGDSAGEGTVILLVEESGGGDAPAKEEPKKEEPKAEAPRTSSSSGGEPSGWRRMWIPHPASPPSRMGRRKRISIPISRRPCGYSARTSPSGT